MSSLEINLLPDLVLQRRHEARVKELAIVGLIVWAVLVILITLGALGYRLIQAQRLASAKSHYTQLDSVVNSSDNVAFRAEAQEVQTSLKALDDLYSKQERSSIVITRLSSLLPKGVTLSSFNLSDGRNVSIGGSGGSYTDVAKLVTSLKDSKKNSASDQVYFENILFGGTNLTDSGAAFSIKMNYVYPPRGDSNASTK